jgi:uncharacterized membrane protein
MPLVIYYVATLVAFLGVDFFWLKFASEKLYRPTLGAMLLDKPVLSAALAFYLLYIAAGGFMVECSDLRRAVRSRLLRHL